MIRQPSLLLTVLGLALSIGFARAAFARSDFISKIGVDVRGLRTNLNPSMGWVGGVRANRFLGKSNAYVGLGVNYGSPTGGSPDTENLFYFGATIGYDGKFSREIVYEIAFLLGYGEGRFDLHLPPVHEVSYLVAEPSFGTGFYLGKGWRLLFTLSYLHMSLGPNFSGGMFGVRLDLRTYTTIKPVDP